MDQVISNSQVLEVRINKIGVLKIKLPSIKRFSGKKIKIRNKGVKLLLVVDKVAYVGLFLAGQVLKQFKLYLIEYKANRITIRNAEVKYIFLSQIGFADRLTQIYTAILR